MGRAAARRHRDLEDFEEGHMQQVWDQLHDHFHINSIEWKRRFEEEFLKQPHSITKVDFFRKYLVENFNGYLNHILCRYSWHPTIDNLMEYVVRKGIR